MALREPPIPDAGWLLCEDTPQGSVSSQHAVEGIPYDCYSGTKIMLMLHPPNIKVACVLHPSPLLRTGATSGPGTREAPRNSFMTSTIDMATF